MNTFELAIDNLEDGETLIYAFRKVDGVMRCGGFQLAGGENLDERLNLGFFEFEGRGESMR